MTISAQQWLIYEEHRARGLNQSKAARMASIGISSAKRHDHLHPDGARYRQLARIARNQPDPMRQSQLGPEALKSLKDFNYFQRRYLGRIGLPWQQDAARQIVKLLRSQDKEYVVINAPPGSGKSSFFSYALPLWLTCQDRAIRGLVGSATARLASQYTANIRRALESTLPILADEEDIKKGIAADAEATLSEDFGRFKPVDHESWTKDAFIVSQMDGASITNKEPTWTAVGRDQEFIGGRYDFCIWDDLVTSNRLRSLETVEKDRDWWDTYAERRLEPGGLLILQGQRMGANDLYRYCLDMEVVDIEDDARDDQEGGSLRESEDGGRKKYHQILYPSHYEHLCKGKETHKLTSDPWPKGCLLSPRRVSWREVSSMQHRRPDTFAQVYQQLDVSHDTVLVDPAWISGTGNFVGCWDMERDRLQIPMGLAPPTYSVVSVDPSPTRYWAIEWWLYNEPSDQWFLIDLLRTGLDAPDFLDWHQNENKYYGVMEDWQQMSMQLGAPITHWIVERNGAQRFLLQYDHVKKWSAKNSVQIIPHDTYRNKVDDEFGVQMLAPLFKFGRVRLPGKGAGRGACQQLVKEVTTYSTTSQSKGTTDDCVLSMWMGTFQMQYLAIPSSTIAPSRRPSWLGRKAS